MPFAGRGNGGGVGIGCGGCNGGWSGGVGWDGNEFGNYSSKSFGGGFGLLGLFLNGWRLRVVAHTQLAFKVLMEELVGVTACVLGDMGCLRLRLRVWDPLKEQGKKKKTKADLKRKWWKSSF